MELINLLRAKSEEYENYLLKDHIIETLKRLKRIKEFVNVNKENITYESLKDEKFFESLAVALILHDLGKIDYKFQKSVYKNDDEDWKNVSVFLEDLRDIDIRHEILSSIWASILLDDNVDLEWNAKIRTAILLHHYNDYYINKKDLMKIVEDYPEDVKEYLQFIEKKWEDITKFLNNLLKSIKDEFKNEKFIISAAERIELDLNKVKNLIEKIELHENDISAFVKFFDIDNDNPDYNFLLFLGCLRRCDYSASGGIEIEEEINMKNVYSDIERKIEDKIKEKVKTPEFWQKEFLKSVKPKKSMVLIAPTGAGKTEFALLWAEKNGKKLIYTLPLRVALNDLFRRFRDSDKAYFDKKYVDILHSTSFIEYLEDRQYNREDIDVDKKISSARLISSPILLTTPDQVFLTSLNYYGSDKIISVYPLSCVVIDEIQAYNPDMASIIIKTLEIIKNLGGNVLIMTATFPPYFEFFFREKLKFEIIDVGDIVDKNKIKNYNIKRHKIKVIEDKLVDYVKKKSDKEEIEVNLKALNEWLEKFKGKNIFIVLNNVSKAIAVYKELISESICKEYKSNIYLLHSRLIEKEKSRRIKDIKEKLDKGEKVIVVSTQIIEASVNLDFDAMITEISTIDSQIQRWGRVYRNREKNYSGDANIIIFSHIDKGTTAIYDKKVLENTVKVLKNYNEKVLSYEDERKLIKDVFEMEVKDSGRNAKLKEYYKEEIEKYLDFLKYFSVEKKSQAQNLFRRIAGIQVVIPQIMELNNADTSIEKELAKIIKDKSNARLIWKEICEIIKKETGIDIDEEELKWELRRILYEYSTNVPIYYFEKRELYGHDFKGFYVVSVPKEEKIKEITDYGIDVILKTREEDIENLI